MLVNKISSSLRDISKQISARSLEADSRYAPQGVGRAGLPRYQDTGAAPKSVEEDLEYYDGVFMHKDRIPLYAKVVKFIQDPKVKEMLVAMVSGKSTIGLTYLMSLLSIKHEPGIEGYEAIVKNAYKKDLDSKKAPDPKALEKVNTPEGTHIRKDTQQVYNMLINKIRNTEEEGMLVDILNSPNTKLIQDFMNVVKENKNMINTPQGVAGIIDTFEKNLKTKGQASPVGRCASYLKELSVRVKEAGYDKLSSRLAMTSFKLLLQ